MEPKPKLYALALLFKRQARGGLETSLQAGSYIADSADQDITFEHVFAFARRHWPTYDDEGWDLSVAWHEIAIDARSREGVGDA